MTQENRIGGSVVVPCRSAAQQKGAILLLLTVHFSPPDINLLADWAVKASCLSTCVSEMGYVTTPICMVQAGVVIVKEKDRLPKEWVFLLAYLISIENKSLLSLL